MRDAWTPVGIIDTLLNEAGMQITVSGRNLDLSDSLRTRVWDQLNAIDQRYFTREALHVQVTFSRHHHRFICEITVQGARIQLRSEAQDDDAYRAFDRALQPLAERVLQTRRRRRRRGEASEDNTLRNWMTPDAQ
jgi:ribosomal subunit interface protein